MIQCNAIIPNGDKAKENYCTVHYATLEDVVSFNYLPSNDKMRMSNGVCETTCQSRLKGPVEPLHFFCLLFLAEADDLSRSSVRKGGGEAAPSPGGCHSHWRPPKCMAELT